MAATRFHSGFSERRMSVLHVGEGLATGVLGNVFVVVWREPVTVERLGIEREGLRSAIRRQRGQVAMVRVIEPSSELASDELKQLTQALFAEHERDLVSVATVIEGGGFRAAALRAVFSTIQLRLGRRSFASRCYGSVPDACSSAATDASTGSSALSEAVEELRAMLDMEESVTLIRARADL